MENISSVIIGIICIVLGVFNWKGNISSIHFYHRKRVAEENRRPFGRLMGLGTMMCGVAMILFGGLSAAAELLQQGVFLTVGMILLVAGLAAGLGLSFFAMVKYNKGIF